MEDRQITSSDPLLKESLAQCQSPPVESGCCGKIRQSARECCSVRTLKRRVPIADWLPRYNATLLVQDAVAGITVGLTAIPQGIAYAIVAGLPPQYGLYSSLIPGFIYLVFGSCKDVTVGPTAILSVMVSKYVKGYSIDFAILATFLTGCVILLLGILHLGFLVDFISNPVISGFTTAAAMQIASAQLKALFALQGSSGETFVEAIENFIRNIKTAKLWDPILGFATIFMLILLKLLEKCSSRTWDPERSRLRNVFRQTSWFLCMGRNAVVVVIGIVAAYCIRLYSGTEPFALTGKIDGGLPQISVPPFSTVVGNETYAFTDMLRTYGPQSVVLPLISILESIAIAKAFARGKMLDATQEMIALGLCNMLSAFGQSMPVTGSFTRTAINYASGVQTPAGGIFKGLTVLLALTFLTDTFYYIPRATLAGLIIIAMFYMIDYHIVVLLWRNKKSELFVLCVTALTCLTLGLEYGIVAGVLADALLLIFYNSRPEITHTTHKIGAGTAVLVSVSGSGALPYCAADHVTRAVQAAYARADRPLCVVVDGRNITAMDTSVAKSLMSLAGEVEGAGHEIVLWNFGERVQRMCEQLAGPAHARAGARFLRADSLQPHLLAGRNEGIAYTIPS